MQALFISIPFANAGTYSYFCLSHCLTGMTGVVNVSGGCAPSGWSAGPDMPTSAVSVLVGVYFPAERQVLRHGRSRRRHSRQRVHSPV